MKNIVGKIIYIFSYPVILLLVKNTHRSYVVLLVDNKVLVTRNWLSNKPIWRLPGGGLHNQELPVFAAVRELQEETGIKIEASQLTVLLENQMHKKHFSYDIFYCQLHEQPDIKLDNLEILDAQFIAISDLGTKYQIDEQVSGAIDAIIKKQVQK